MPSVSTEEIRLPEGAAYILKKLNDAGYAAYAVGGCVRDSLLGRTPKDWDIATSARPTEVASVFSGERLLETGLQHGTVTLLLEGEPYEITTFRMDGRYTDCRRPDRVEFTSSLEADLARRDFTVGAMAYHPSTGVVDLYGGRADLEARVIRCVGDPAQRFTEDALRMLRALRFASELDFTIEPATLAAAEAYRGLLMKVSAERIRSELDRLLCGRGVGRVLRTGRLVLEQILPELGPTVDLSQRTPYHIYDVFEHTLRTVEAAPPEATLRLTMLFHDLGKPACFRMDASGRGHFPGHPQESARLAEKILGRLRYDNQTAGEVLTLVRLHDYKLKADPVAVRRLLSRIGEARFRQLLAVQRADAAGKAPVYGARQIALVGRVEETLNQVVERGDCVSLHQLAVDGHALMAVGIPAGPVLGKTLHSLLEQVMEEKLPNERQTLLQAGRQIYASNTGKNKTPDGC